MERKGTTKLKFVGPDGTRHAVEEQGERALKAGEIVEIHDDHVEAAIASKLFELAPASENIRRRVRGEAKE